MKNKYITTPIYYPNAKAHIGTAYTTIICDVLARYERLYGNKVVFTTGLDEHGQKIQESALKNNVTPQQWVDKMSEDFESLWKLLKISNDDYIRTTQDRHLNTVKEVIKKVYENGDIYAGEYKGKYCVSEETFVTESQLVDGKYLGKEVIEVSEPTYFFRLSKYADKLLKYYDEHPNFILPKHRKNEVVSFILQGLQDLSISRTTFTWGIPLELNDKHIIYVWFDALNSYLTGANYKNEEIFNEVWNNGEVIHFIGKDILRFHAIIWPAMLMSAGIKLPDTVAAHGWWTVEGEKMSKSLGNTILPKDITEKYGADILRLWVSSVDYREDVRISENILQQMSDAYRRIRNTARFLMGNLNDFDYANDKVDYKDMFEIDKWAMHKLEELKAKTTEFYDKYEFYSLFQEITYFCSMEMSSFYLDIVKDRLYCENKKSLERRSAQTVLTEVLRVLVRVISPVLSFTAEEIWERIPESIKEEESVHLTSWIEANPEYKNEELAKKWEKIYHLRKEVNKKLEAERQNGMIGHSLDARVLLNISNDEYAFLKEYTEAEVSDLFIVSQVKFVNDRLNESEIDGITIAVEKASGEKCERCWKYDEEVGHDHEHTDVCPRCAKVLNSLEK